MKLETFSLWTIASIVNYVLVLVAIENIIRKRRDPRGMLAWILALLLLPFLGLVLFLLIGTFPIQRKIRRRRRRRLLIAPALREHAGGIARDYDAARVSELDADQRAVMETAMRISGAPVTTGNAVSVTSDAEHSFLNLSLAIDAAESHVHLEYYIFHDDETGRATRDLLAKKVSHGVEVRLLLDAVGCWRLPRRFVREMQAAGITVAFFLPWGLSGRRFNLNFRNHRKLVVVDGRAGYIGSKNIGDEYLGRRRKFGSWRDSHVWLRGPAVSQLQEIFVEDWHFTTNQRLTDRKYFPPPQREGDSMVQIVASGPDRSPNVMHQLLFAAVSDADRDISIITPYFVPDPSMVLALESAAKRGVNVRLMLPAISDHPLVLWAGRSSYEELLDAGIEIYEWETGMLHSKEVVIDQRWAMIGSANMDVRSFRLNFEVTSILYDNGIAQALQADFDRLRGESRRIRQRDLAAWTYPQVMAAGMARLAVPIL